VPFQNCVLVTAAIKNVGPVCPTFLIAAVIKNENFINGQLRFYYKSKLSQILTAAIWQ
jgi:hypothetical protein